MRALAVRTPRYSGELQLTDALVIDVLRKVQEFDLRRAYNMCMRYCARHVGASNAIDWLIRAHVCRLHELRAVVLDYVRLNSRLLRDEARRRVGELCAHPDLMHEVMTVLM